MKESKTISESRGLKVEDRAKAADFLLHNNHYRASGCSLTLRDHDVFFPNARFQNIMGIYESDRKLGTGTKSNQMSLADWMRKWIGTQKKREVVEARIVPMPGTCKTNPLSSIVMHDN